MMHNRTYLEANIHKILFDWSDGNLTAPVNVNIKYITSFDSKVRKEVIEIFTLVGEKFEACFEEMEPTEYYDLNEDFGEPGTWYPALITICINLKQEVIEINSIDCDSFGTPIYLLSFSKPER